MSDDKRKRSALGWILIVAEVLLVLLVVRWFLQNRPADAAEAALSGVPDRAVFLTAQVHFPPRTARARAAP